MPDVVRPKYVYDGLYITCICFDCVCLVFYGQLLEHLVLRYCPALLSVHCYCCFLYSGQINDDIQSQGQLNIFYTMHTHTHVLTAVFQLFPLIHSQQSVILT